MRWYRILGIQTDEEMTKFLLIIITLGALLMGCEKNEMPLFDTPFVYILTSDGASTATVGSDVDNVNTYYICLSATNVTENVTVDFSFTAGAGIKEGVDYVIVTEGTTLTFLPGIYRMPVRVRWKPHTLDNAADNTLTIALTGCSRDCSIGMPGPDGKMSSVTITKKNL